MVIVIGIIIGTIIIKYKLILFNYKHYTLASVFLLFTESLHI